jgi:hypothetical protein
MKKIGISFIIILFILSGCDNTEGGKVDDLALVKRTNPEPMDIINGMDENGKGIITDVKKSVAKHEAIYDVIVVKKDKTILVAYKVKHLKRFHMKRIEKEVTEQLNKQFKGYDFIVSSDYKIFLELVRLNEMLKAKDVPEEKARKKYEEIISLHEELT